MNTPQAPISEPLPMDNSMDNMNGMDDMGDNMENMPNMDMPNDENPYDANFDAGVEANEEDDPKRFIEQLSGKLSQSLRSYQEGLPNPDADTAKYAAGMVIKAAIEGLSQEDIKDILAKLDEDESDDENENNDNDSNEEQMEFDGLESKNRHTGMIDEIFQEITKPNEDEEMYQKRNTKTSYKKKPFVAPYLK